MNVLSPPPMRVIETDYGIPIVTMRAEFTACHRAYAARLAELPSCPPLSGRYGGAAVGCFCGDVWPRPRTAKISSAQRCSRRHRFEVRA